MIGVIAAVGSAVFAGFATRDAKKARATAEAANMIATGAVAKADEANKIAKDANELSEKANGLVARSVAQQEEGWFVEWAINWDEDHATLTLANQGLNTAREVTFVVVGDGFSYRSGPDNPDVPAGETYDVEIPQIMENRSTHEAERRQVMSQSPWMILGSYYVDTTVTVRWRTGQGFPGTQKLEIQLA